MTPPVHTRRGAVLGLSVGVGCSLGVVVATTTGGWHWMPIVLSACIGIGALLGLRVTP